MLSDFKQWQKVRLSDTQLVIKILPLLTYNRVIYLKNAMLCFMKDKENSKTTGAFNNMLKYFIFSSILDFWVK